MPIMPNTPKNQANQQSIDLPFAEYQFDYQINQKLTIPALSGTLWHSVFGKALHQLNCKTQQHNCQNCHLKTNCHYTQIFTGKTNNKPKPAPHLFKSNFHKERINTQQTLSTRLILIGNINQQLPQTIQAMQKVGQNGFGKDRIKATLKKITQHTPYGIQREIHIKNRPEQMGLALHYPILQPIKKLRIEFITPFRHQHPNKQEPRFQIDYFLMNLVRRISQLQYYYGLSRPNDNYKQLKHASQSLPIIDQQMQNKTFNSLKKRKNQHHQSQGWLGYIDINIQEYPQLWKYLYLGQWLNAGKNASMGFGQYQLIDLQ